MPTTHLFDIKLIDGAFFPDVQGADESDAIEWLGAQLGQDVAHLQHEITPCENNADVALYEGWAA